jgi:hypothetical protein
MKFKRYRIETSKIDFYAFVIRYFKEVIILDNTGYGENLTSL